MAAFTGGVGAMEGVPVAALVVTGMIVAGAC